MICKCRNVRRKRATALGHEGMTLQGGAVLPQSPLLRIKRIQVYLSRLWGSTSPILLHGLVEVRVDPSVSP